MMSNRFIISGIAVLTMGLFILAACSGKITVVDSGTYEGTIKEVNAEEKEIYVSLTQDKLIELYFSQATILLRQGEEVPFKTLEKGQNVRVKVQRVGNALDPSKVEILESQ